MSVILMSACLGTAMGTVSTTPIAAASTKIALTSITESQQDVSLLVNPLSGSNQVELALQIDNSYNNSITSVEMHMKMGDTKIKKVTMEWDSSLDKSSCRSLYDQNTGVLRVFIISTSDLIENRMISIGTLKYESSEKDTFSTTLTLEKISTVDLTHKGHTPVVTEVKYPIEFTYNDITPSTAPSTKPETPSPSQSSNPSGSDEEDDKPENGSNGTNKEESSLSDSSESESETESKEDTAVNEEETLEGSESSEIEDTTNREESEVVSDDISAEVTIDGTEESEVSNMFAIIAAIVASVIVLGGVGFVVWKRKQGTENEEE